MSSIKSMLYSVRNSTAVQQLDGLFKLFEGISERLKSVDDEVNADDQWFG